MIVVEKYAFISSDWHDWRNYTEYLNDGDDMSGLDIEVEIVKNFQKKNFCFTDEAIQKIADFMKNLNEEEHIEVGVTGEKEECLYDGESETVLITKQKDVYRFSVNGSIFDDNCSYYIYDIPDEEVRYLPVWEYRCWPKRSPIAQRTFTKPFKTKEEAQKFNDDLFEKHKHSSYPFHEMEKIVIISSEKRLTDDEWYKKNMGMLAKYDNFWEAYHPSMYVHKSFIEARKRCKDCKNLTIDGEKWFCNSAQERAEYVEDKDCEKGVEQHNVEENN